MTKVFQTNFNPGTHTNPGNCWQAQIASLLSLDLNQVPNFIEYGDDANTAVIEFLAKNGYQYDGYVHNPRRLGCDGNFSEVTDKVVYELEGVDGLFAACVWSPKYFTMEAMCDWNQVQPIHAVIMDKHFNIVHDPNPNYAEVKEYPLANILGWNGIIGFDIIRKV